MQLKQINEFKTAQEATQYAIEYQNWASEQNQIGEEPTLYTSDLIEYQTLFEALAKKFHLIREFKEI